jgi:hypothetical protein
VPARQSQAANLVGGRYYDGLFSSVPQSTAIDLRISIFFGHQSSAGLFLPGSAVIAIAAGGKHVSLVSQ